MAHLELVQSSETWRVLTVEPLTGATSVGWTGTSLQVVGVAVGVLVGVEVLVKVKVGEAVGVSVAVEVRVGVLVGVATYTSNS